MSYLYGQNLLKLRPDWFPLGVTKSLSPPRWSPLGVKFKISDEHPRLFHMGVPPRVAPVSKMFGVSRLPQEGSVGMATS